MGSYCASVEEPPLYYPLARRDESVDDYPGVKISDPYRWLEESDADEVKVFVRKQASLTKSLLRTSDTREKIRQLYNQLFFDRQKFDPPFWRGNKFFVFYNSGSQDQNVLWVKNSLNLKVEVLLDLNGIRDEDGGAITLKKYAISEDAKYLAYGISARGKDQMTIKVKRVEDKTVEPDTLSWVKFSSISWTHDSKGFFYSCYPAPKEGEQIDAETEYDANLCHEVYYHFLGTDQSQDVLCWKDSEHSEYLFKADFTDDEKYVLLYIQEGCDPVNKLYYCDLSLLINGLEGLRERNEMLPFTKLVDNFEASYRAVANDDTLFTFLTNKDAPKYKLVRVDLKEPTVWTDVLQESEKDVLESAYAVNGSQILVSYLSDVKNVLQCNDSVVFIGFTSFLTPGMIYRCNLKTEDPEMNIFHELLVPGFDRSEFQVNQVFVASKDGTKIPMFIVSKKNILHDVSHHCLLFGFGGFNTRVSTSFRVKRMILFRHLGVVFCSASIRGGGEYGEEWHKAGSLGKKQNSFDDFISAAEFLVSAGYTQPKKLCIEGGGNGGLLVAACINQRPDLSGCALANVGLMDMLRFHKFSFGYAWTSEYGCSEKEEEFHWLIKYSPLHNVIRPWEQMHDKTCQYLSTMLLTPDRHDIISPLHTLKLLATMQYVLCTSSDNSLQTNPIVGRIDCDAVHGAGRSIRLKVIDIVADKCGFMAEMLGVSWIN